MRRSSLLRYVLWGAAGFGVGLPLSVILFGSFGAEALGGFAVGGALGGAALGIALRKWIAALALSLLGAMGFGAGFFVGSVFLFLVGSPWPYFFQGMIAGAVEGATLGLALLGVGWKNVVTLFVALGGAIGFGIGGRAADILIQAFMEPGAVLPSESLFAASSAVNGAIGGATLGTTLGLLKRRNLDEHSPPVR